MKVTSILKDFVEKYVKENFPVPYEVTSFEAFKKTLEEQIEDIYRRADEEALKLFNEAVEGVPEYADARAEFNEHSRTYMRFQRTEAFKMYRAAHEKMDANRNLIISRMLAEASSLKTIDELVESMDKQIQEYKD